LLFNYLKEIGIGIVGTVKIERLKMRKEIKKNIKNIQLDKFNYESYISDNLHLCLYNDRKLVKILTNCYDNEVVEDEIYIKTNNSRNKY